MKPAPKMTVYAFAGAMLLGLGTASANAMYLGYGNGDPGNWDFATEQAGGPCAHSYNAQCCLQYNPESACPLARTEHPYKHRARRALKHHAGGSA